jgi:hypothetical protein
MRRWVGDLKRKEKNESKACLITLASTTQAPLIF